MSDEKMKTTSDKSVSELIFDKFVEGHLRVANLGQHILSRREILRRMDKKGISSDYRANNNQGKALRRMLELPEEIVAKTSKKYLQAFTMTIRRETWQKKRSLNDSDVK